MGSLAQNSFGRSRLRGFRRVPAQMADEVPEGSGADG